MTGTPISKDMRDLYHLFKILSIDPWDDCQCWKHLIEIPCRNGCPIGGSTNKLAFQLYFVLLVRNYKIEGYEGFL